MERNSLMNSNKKQMVREYWNRKSQISCCGGGDDYINGFSWPPGSYTCSFCKREFRSAQALGGHMNVHRRDRARLRQSPPPTPTHETRHSNMLNLNLYPTSGPDFSTSTMSLLPSSPSSSSSSTMLKKPFSVVSPTLASSSSSYDLKKWVVDGIMLNPSSTKASESTKMKNATYAQEDGCNAVKNADIIRLDLHIGLLSDSKDDLDLELRLGTYA